MPLWCAGIVEFESQCSYANTFLDVQIWAEVTAPSGRIIRREAYWDGANTYKVSFAPAEPGIWQARLEAPGETGLDGTAWTVEAVPYEGNLAIYQHGVLREIGRASCRARREVGDGERGWGGESG